MRAIDLYAGIGGWSLGLKLAGVEVVSAYEWWKPATETYSRNLKKDVTLGDIRSLDLNDLPQEIDLVVGSPPCTEFSYSNRGGNGDLAEGFADLTRFFEIVQYLNPQYWVLENVPRVAALVQEGMRDRKGPFSKFKKLEPEIHVLDFSEFGLPQARRRCLIGNIPFELLLSYRAVQKTRGLGQVVEALGKRTVIDPTWGIKLKAQALTDAETERALAGEELRMNKEAKLLHPVYNRMDFPDELHAPSRTITATCTRVSRESIIIENAKRSGSFRRLSIRERATLQGFPITFQLFGSSQTQRMAMIGNAMPPPVAYLVANSVKQVAAGDLLAYERAGASPRMPKLVAKANRPAQSTSASEIPTKYSRRRRFRAVIPTLWFGSGVRFDLSNGRGTQYRRWTMRFYFGPSTKVKKVIPRGGEFQILTGDRWVEAALEKVYKEISRLNELLDHTTPTDLQLSWTRHRKGTSPFELVDALGMAARALQRKLGTKAKSTSHTLLVRVLKHCRCSHRLVASNKILEKAPLILSGMILAAWFNSHAWHREVSSTRLRRTNAAQPRRCAKDNSAMPISKRPTSTPSNAIHRAT